MKTTQQCPKCLSSDSVKAGTINGRQRRKCKQCGYHFSVGKLGKQIDPYFMIKGLQLYLEGLSYREIERIIGVSHVTISKWVKHQGLQRPSISSGYRPTYKILSHSELTSFMSKAENLAGKGLLITEVGDKFMVIRWERFR